MTTIELNTKDLQKINGGTKKDYNNGRDLGLKLMDTLRIVAYYQFRHYFL
ncbi:bacteriocin [Bacteroidota bacterium]|jgi:bacteriocin-like protein